MAREKNHIMIKDEGKKVLEVIGISKKDYERYWKWNKK